MEFTIHNRSLFKQHNATNNFIIQVQKTYPIQQYNMHRTMKLSPISPFILLLKI